MTAETTEADRTGTGLMALALAIVGDLVSPRERGRYQAFAAVMLGSSFASNALYPADVMPVWVRAITRVNPLSYEGNALRQLLLGRLAR